MRITLPTALAVAVFLLAGCAAAPSPGDSGAGSAASTPVPDGGLPVDALPATERTDFIECPYLDTQWVAETNGQKVTGVGVDRRFDTPACQYWSYPEEPQLTVVVRHTASPADAMAVVDWAAPVGSTAPAAAPTGWNGGRAGGGQVPGHAGALYSVANGPVAVSVWTNQQESVKAQAVAEKVIAALGLP